MELAKVYKCPCSGRTYPSNKSLLAHQKTKMHLNWMNGEELRSIKIELTRKDNKILKLKRDNNQLMRVNELLLDRIQKKKLH